MVKIRAATIVAAHILAGKDYWSGICRGQCLFDIGNDIVKMFNTNSKSNIARGHAGF
jgi:hypothetical protein